MRAKLSSAIAMVLLFVTPALAQVAQQPSMSSGAGIHGQPGGKNGPAMLNDGNTSTQQSNPTTAQQDTKGIQGKPGSKSGAAVTPPSKAANSR